jgi:hypothetical protein
MTARELCASGNHEWLKCGVHASACAIAGVMAAYNIAAWRFRRQPHLWINGVIYTLACAWEVKQTLHHVTVCEQSERHASTIKPAA